MRRTHSVFSHFWYTVAQVKSELFCEYAEGEDCSRTSSCGPMMISRQSGRVETNNKMYKKYTIKRHYLPIFQTGKVRSIVFLEVFHTDSEKSINAY